MEGPPLPALTNMECVALIVIALVSVVPCLVLAWLMARVQTRLAYENRTLITSVLGLSEKPSAVMLSRQMETTNDGQIQAESERRGHPVPSRRPQAGAT